MNSLQAVGREALQVNGDDFRSFVKQQTSLSLGVMMAGFTEVFVLPNDALH